MKNETMTTAIVMFSAFLLFAIAAHVRESKKIKKSEMKREELELDDAVEWVKNYLAETTPFENK